MNIFTMMMMMKGSANCDSSKKADIVKRVPCENQLPCNNFSPDVL